MATYWRAIGSVRGACGHDHREMRAAAKCAARDKRWCRSLGGGSYSDRTVVKIVDGEKVYLTEQEALEIAHYMEERC